MDRSMAEKTQTISRGPMYLLRWIPEFWARRRWRIQLLGQWLGWWSSWDILS